MQDVIDDYTQTGITNFLPYFIHLANLNGEALIPQAVTPQAMTRTTWPWMDYKLSWASHWASRSHGPLGSMICLWQIVLCWGPGVELGLTERKRSVVHSDFLCLVYCAFSCRRAFLIFWFSGFEGVLFLSTFGMYPNVFQCIPMYPIISYISISLSISLSICLSIFLYI